MTNIYYTEDYDEVPEEFEGFIFYNDCDETLMELSTSDGKVIASCYIDDWCESVGIDLHQFREDKTYVYDKFIESCFNDGEVS